MKDLGLRRFKIKDQRLKIFPATVLFNGKDHLVHFYLLIFKLTFFLCVLCALYKTGLNHV